MYVNSIEIGQILTCRSASEGCGTEELVNVEGIGVEKDSAKIY